MLSVRRRAEVMAGFLSAGLMSKCIVMLTAAECMDIIVFWLEHKKIAVGVDDLLRYVWYDCTTCMLGKRVRKYKSGPWTILLRFTTDWNSPVWLQTSANNGLFQPVDILEETDLGRLISFRSYSSRQLEIRFHPACPIISHTDFSPPQPLPVPTSYLPPQLYVWRTPAPSPATQTLVVWACVHVCICCGEVIQDATPHPRPTPYLPDLHLLTLWILSVYLMC